MEAKHKPGATAVRPLMKVSGGPHRDVHALVRANSSDRFAEGFEEFMAERAVVDALVVMRGTASLTQADLASRMGCTQSKVSKLESSVDAELSLGDLTLYAAALGVSLSVKFSAIEEAATQEIGVKPAGVAKAARKPRKRSATSG